jgi:hypothetical protein
LDEALAASRTGTGRIVLLVGEPGIGKTRLTEEFTTRATAAGGEVLAGRCFEGPGAPAFWPWLQVIRAYAGMRDARTLAAELGSGAADVAAIVPELHERLPGLGEPPQLGQEQARFRFFDAVSRALLRAAVGRPIAVVLDDLQGADVSSLLLLQFLARELRASNVVVVGTLRTMALTPGNPLADTLGELVREQVSTQLELAGLGIEEVAELMGEMAGTRPSRALVEAVFARTEGNPLYITEVARALVAHPHVDGVSCGELVIPVTVRAAIGRNVGALSPAARETLTLASLFGREFRAEVVARTGTLPLETVLSHIAEAVSARVIAPQSGEAGRYRFAHALFGEVLLDSLGEMRRVALHRKAAQALAADPRAGELVPEIAHHWFAAGATGDPAEAVTWARRAGERASAVLAYEEAAVWYRRALTALDWMKAVDSVPAPPLAHPRAGEPTPAGARTMFRHEADYWAVSFGGTTVRLRDARGLRYLATLLYHPGREFHATELANDTGEASAVSGVAAHDDALGVRRSLDADGPDAIDARAQRDYRARMRDLADELADAERMNDLGRAGRVREELGSLRDELVTAARGGRGRTHGERARLTVTKGIGAALARIEAVHPTLGTHLRATVRRGYFCVYVPDPRHPIVWEP